MKIALTQQFVNKICPEPGKSKTEWTCTLVPGFFVEARATSPGRGSYWLRFKGSDGRTRYKRIGDTLSMTLSEARAKAKELKAEIQLGADPAQAARKQKQVPLFKAFAEDQFMPYIKSRKRSYRDDRNRLRQHLIPAFGDQPLNTVTRKQLVDLHLRLKDSGLSGATCDHFIKLVRAMYNVAIQWGVVTENPAARIPLFREPNQVENYLSEEQLRRLLTVLHTNENRTVSRIALFLLCSGARLNEALTATWEQLDLVSNTWRIPASISKSKKVRAVPLNASAIDVLDEIEPNPELRWGFLFVNARTGTNLKTVHRAWYKIREEAGVPFLRLHDLRHMYASFLVNAGRTLYEVQQVLGHSSPTVTQRYAHLTTRTLQDASNSASDRIRAASPRLLPSPARLAS